MDGEGVRGYLAAIWRCRYFWLALVKMDLNTRYRRSVLGIGWSLLHPLAMTVILCAVFSQIMNQPIRDYGPLVLSGLALWNYLTSVIRDGCHSMHLGESYIRQFPAPLAIYPLRATLGASFHFLLSLALVLVLTWVLKGYTNPLALLSLLPALVLLFLLAWSLAIIFSFVTVYFPDTQHLTEVVLQILFYATPILYPPELLESRRLGILLRYNPLTSLLRIVREPILEGRIPSTGTCTIAGLTLVLVAGIAIGVLARCQRKLIFYL